MRGLNEYYPLNSHFLLFVSLAQIRDRRPLRKRGTAEDFYYRRGAQCAPISLPLRSAGFRTATHIGCSTQARHTRVAQLVCSVVMDGICGFCLITDDTVGCDLGAPLVTHLHLAQPQGRPLAARTTLYRCVILHSPFSILHLQNLLRELSSNTFFI